MLIIIYLKALFWLILYGRSFNCRVDDPERKK